jgi:hypothetical protein
VVGVVGVGVPVLAVVGVGAGALVVAVVPWVAPLVLAVVDGLATGPDVAVTAGAGAGAAAVDTVVSEDTVEGAVVVVGPSPNSPPRRNLGGPRWVTW